ncbi:hypothetical protein [Mailhella massiliensis]|uniref:hypothetical protein n=1 Tax=Mailhella massiliensis TaxID=1903261 RepID=UPI00097CEF87|nr:hypothetical protein [Mailhella massiliensis]
MSQLHMPLLSPDASASHAEEVSPVATTTTTATTTTSPAEPGGETSVSPAPADRVPVAVQLQGAERRIERLLGRAAGHLPGLTGSMYAHIRNEVPRPPLFAAGWRKHGDMTAAAQRCDRAAAALARIPVKAFTAQPPAEAHVQALREYTEAQNALYGAIRAFMERKGESPLLAVEMQRTQFRAAEALNLAASLQLAGRTGDFSPEERAVRGGMADKLADMGEGANMLEGMRAVSPSMHGHVLLDALVAQSKAAFAALDELERNTDMTADDFRMAAGEVKRQVEQLRGQVDTLDVSRGALLGEPELREALKGMVERAAERLETLRQINPGRDVCRAIDELMPAINENLTRSCYQLMPREVKGLARTLWQEAAACNREVSQLKQQVQAGALTSLQLHDGLQNAISRLREGEAGQCVFLLFAMHVASEGGIRNTEAFQAECRNRAGLHISRRTAQKLMDMARSEDFQQSAVGALASMLMGAPHVRADILEAQLGEISAMCHTVESNRPFLRGEYVAAALEGHVDAPTIVEASLRGIPADQLEVRAGDAVRKSARVLGHGAANTVQLCTYRNEGDDVKLVFKPEAGARQGLDNLMAGHMGYEGGVRIMQINVAACRAADAIGCGNVVARSSVGMNDGRLGLFMEAAPGCTARDVRLGKPCAFTVDGRSLSFAEALSHLDGKKLGMRVRGNLMRELNRLEWADFLSGQVDRHPDNYLVFIHADTGEVKVTGIDNDASFGWRKVGATRVDITGDIKAHNSLMAEGVVFPPMNVDVSALTGAQKDEMALAMGEEALARAMLNMASFPEARVALQQAGMNFPPVIVSVDRLTAQQKRALEAALGQSVLPGTTVNISGSAEAQRALLTSGVVLPREIVRTSKLTEDQRRIFALAAGRFMLTQQPQVNIAAMPALQQRLRNLGLDLPRVVVDAAGFSENQLIALRNCFGFNQLFRPSCIDRETYLALKSIDENAYRRTLASCLDEEAVEAAMLRLRDAKAVADELATNGRVVDNWENKDLLDRMAEERISEGRLSTALKNGFFQRDFIPLLK